MLKSYVLYRTSFRCLAKSSSSANPPGSNEDKSKRIENLQKGFGETARTLKDAMPGSGTREEDKPSMTERVQNIKTGFQETARTVKEGVESFMPGHTKKEHEQHKGIAGQVYEGVNKTLEGVAGAVKSVFQGSPSQTGPSEGNKSQMDETIKKENEAKTESTKKSRE